MKYKFDYSRQKDLLLIETRKISFEVVIQAIESGNVLDHIDHFNKKKYPNQKIFIVRVGTKVYAVPYVIDRVKKIRFLKTIYPSSSLRQKYVKK